VLDRAMDIVWLMREELQSGPEVLNLGEGVPRRTVDLGYYPLSGKLRLSAANIAVRRRGNSTTGWTIRLARTLSGACPTYRCMTHENCEAMLPSWSWAASIPRLVKRQQESASGQQ
jgi:hypothetical protein